MPPLGGSSERGPRPVASTGRSIATVQQTRSAISHFHAAAGIGKGDNPALHPVVSEAVKGWRNRAPAPRDPHLRRPGPGPRGPPPAQERPRRTNGVSGHRPAARCPRPGHHRGYGRRRTTALRSRDPDLGDVELWDDRTGRITVQKGKNQGEPATVAVTAATARALRDIRPEDVDPAALVFGLTGETLANRVHAAARAAGLGDGFTGQSGRIGMARRTVAAGAPNAAGQR